MLYFYITQYYYTRADLEAWVSAHRGGKTTALSVIKEPHAHPSIYSGEHSVAARIFSEELSKFEHILDVNVHQSIKSTKLIFKLYAYKKGQKEELVIWTQKFSECVINLTRFLNFMLESHGEILDDEFMKQYLFHGERRNLKTLWHFYKKGLISSRNFQTPLIFSRAGALSFSLMKSLTLRFIRNGSIPCLNKSKKI